jgi:hypothetical protein
MFTNGSSIANNTVLKTQVCVVGSGPAGITVAWDLQNAGFDVILLEGSRDVGTGPGYVQQTWDDKTALYGGDSIGLFTPQNEPGFLVRPNWQYSSGASERERAFGGTSTHWGGQSRPLDAVALAGRGQTYPAWPVTRDELDPWYQAAAKFCNLYGSFDAEYWAQILGAEVPAVPGFDTAMYQYIGGDFLNFATRLFPDGKTICKSKANVIINATLLDINIDRVRGCVQSLSVASMKGNPDETPEPDTTFTVQADRYVLALGAVANARQLLLAKIPNDNIGRYFMCHPLVQNYLDNKGNPITISGNPFNASQQQLLQGRLADGKRWQGDNGVVVSGRLSPNAEQQQALKMGSCWIWGNGGQGLYFEQAPNPDSRVMLANTKDQVFEQPQTCIDWRFSPADEYTYTQSIELLRKGLPTSAKVTAAAWSDIEKRVVVNGHHLGTTRMSETAADGVVDKNLRSHDLDNLYVAGSSVWRTACIPNPTFSIIMFSLRLADHLKRELGQKHRVDSSAVYAEA